MKKSYKIIAFILIIILLFVLTFKSCRHFWNPHYLDNKAINIDNKLFSPDSSVAVVYYTLDNGAINFHSYKTILRPQDYDNDLLTNNLPEQIIVLGWHDNKTLDVKCDPNEAIRLGGGVTDLDLTKDTLIRNGVTIIIRERVAKIKNYIP